MLRIILYSFLMGVIFLCACAYQQTIYVLIEESHLPQTCTASRNESKDSEDNTTTMTCNSIASLAIILNNNSFQSIEVILHSGVHRLTEPISLFNYVNVTIRPTNNTGLARIVCANESVGGVQPVIQFMHSRQVQISRVHIEYCSGNVFIRNTSRLLIHDCLFRYDA